MRHLTRLLLPPLVLAAACSDAGVTKFNASPTARITSHATGDTAREGDLIELQGTVGDPDHDAASLTVDWVVDGTIACGATVPEPGGNVSCTAAFAATGGVIQLDVTDPSGASGQDRVEIDIMATDAPVADITAPTIEGTYYSNQLITFAGVAGDTEDVPTDLTVTFETDGLGDLGLAVDITADGHVEAFGNLPEGEHAVRMRVVDSDGKEARDSVVIHVGPSNTAPTCGILLPTDGAAGADGSEVRFEGTVGDVDVANDLLVVSWSSDVDGALRESTPDTDGTVAFATTALTVATHRITLTATDEVGAACSDSIYYTVGTPPSLVVHAPVDGSTHNEGQPVAFAATVSDDQDLPTDLEMSWQSDRDGGLSAAGADSTGEAGFTSSTLSAGTHTVQISVTDTDGLYTIRSLGLTINAVPTAPTVSISPDPATTTHTLTASASGSIDPDGSGTVTYGYTWYEDGVLSAVSTSAAFPSTGTLKHHTYRVVVTPSDGVGSGPTGTAEITVGNAIPTLSGPSLSATSVQVGDGLTCTASATDADPSDSVSLTYAWQDGSSGTTYAVTSSDSPGDAITCTVTADDGDGGTVSASASATVANSDPVLTSVTVSPSSGQVGDVLTCAATASDADGDTPVISYLWSDGSTASTLSLTSSHNPGTTVTCTVTATDGDGGTDTGSASAAVDNTDPVLSSVTISPTSATNDDTLVCSASATDADGGSPTVSFAWTSVDTGASLSASASLDLMSAAVASAETVRCTATATDTDGGTDTGSATLTVDNRAPDVSVSLTPTTSVSSSDTLTCTATVSDDDGDSLTTTFAWTVASMSVPASTTSGLTSTLAGMFSSGQTVQCAAMSEDSKGGSTTDTASVTVTNDAPVLSSVTLSPTTLYTNDTATVSATASDPDGDPITMSYDWYVDSVLVQTGTSTTLSGGAWFDKHETVTVQANASDGADTTSLTASGVTVLNTLPTAPTVVITPSAPTSGDALVCSITTASTDADLDSITYAMAWTVDGVAYQAGSSLDSGLDSGAPGWDGPSTTTWTDDTVDGDDVGYGETWVCTATPNDGEDDGTPASTSVTTDSGSSDYVLFVTAQVIGSSSSSWIQTRIAADAYCASYAGSNGISGSDFRVVYSTASEDAKDYVDYDASRGDRVYDRNGRQIDNGDLWSTTSVLPDMNSWTIVATGTSGTHQTCTSSPGAWPICQYCSKTFACGSSSNAPFNPGSCCSTGTRSVICMGKQ